MFHLGNTTLRGHDLQEPRARDSAGCYASLLSFPKTIYQSSTQDFQVSVSLQQSSIVPFLLSVIYRSSKPSASILRPTMLRPIIIRPLVKSLTEPCIRCFPRHHFAPPTFLPLPRARLSPAKARYPEIHARRVFKKAVSKENQGKQPSNSSTDGHNNKNGGSSLPSTLYFLALLFFILGARRRREGRQHEGQQDESAVDTNREVDLEGTRD